MLTAAGYTTVHPSGRHIATRAVDSPTTVAALQQLGQKAERLAADVVPQLKSNILLVHACMEALPQILTGARLLVSGPLCVASVEKHPSLLSTAARQKLQAGGK